MLGRLAILTLCALPLAAADPQGLLGDAPAATAAPAVAAPTASDGEILRLVSEGKAAATRFNAAPTTNAGAIVDAAVFFESARRLISGSTDQAVVTDIQDNLFWCRKQMDLDALTAFRARMRNEDLKPAPLRLKAMAGPPPKSAPKPASAPTVPAKPGDDVQAVWTARLRDRIRASLAIGRQPQFHSSLFQTTATISAIADDGTLSVSSAGGGMQLPWRLLTDSDRVSMALELTHDDVPEQHALAAYYLLLTGDRNGAQLRLAKAGALGDEVRRAFPGAR